MISASQNLRKLDNDHDIRLKTVTCNFKKNPNIFQCQFCHVSKTLIHSIGFGRHSVVVTFRLRRSRGEMHIGHGRLCLCVCLSVPRRILTLLHGPGCNLGEW